MTRKYAVRYEKAAIKALKKMDKYQVGLILAWIEKNLQNAADPIIHGKKLPVNKYDYYFIWELLYIMSKKRKLGFRSMISRMFKGILTIIL